MDVRRRKKDLFFKNQIKRDILYQIPNSLHQRGIAKFTQRADLRNRSGFGWQICHKWPNYDYWIVLKNGFPWGQEAWMKRFDSSLVFEYKYREHQSTKNISRSGLKASWKVFAWPSLKLKVSRYLLWLCWLLEWLKSSSANREIRKIFLKSFRRSILAAPRDKKTENLPLHQTR